MRIPDNRFGTLCAGAVLLIFLPACRYLTSDFRAGNQAAAAGSLRVLSACAETYRSHHPEKGYPASLSLQGPEGDHCIDERLAAGEKNGYRFTYTPGGRERQGRFTRYTATARPIKYRYHGDVNFFVDESGVIRTTHEDRPATAHDPPVGE